VLTAPSRSSAAPTSVVSRATSLWATSKNASGLVRGGAPAAASARTSTYHTTWTS
jgi:hypothetical protein